MNSQQHAWNIMDRIKIKGYKSFKDLDFELKKINLLIGSNGAGKSNFLSFFELLGRTFAHGLTAYVAHSFDTGRLLWFKG